MDSNDPIPPSSDLAAFEQPQSDADLDLFDWNLWSTKVSSPGVHAGQNDHSFDPTAFEDFDFSFRDIDVVPASEIITQEPESHRGESIATQTFQSVDLLSQDGTDVEAPGGHCVSITGSQQSFSSIGTTHTPPLSGSAPRRRGRLSDVVKRGIEELIKAGGACWRCKILRKKVRMMSCTQSLNIQRQGGQQLTPLTHQHM